jgi:hypothetical protein
MEIIADRIWYLLFDTLLPDELQACIANTIYQKTPVFKKHIETYVHTLDT